MFSPQNLSAIEALGRGRGAGIGQEQVCAVADDLIRKDLSTVAERDAQALDLCLGV